MLDSPSRRKRFFANTDRDLRLIEEKAAGDPTVMMVLDACRRLLANFRERLREVPEIRQRLRKELGAILGPLNVLVDPFTLVAHATDATDWRLHLPLAVVMPDEEGQVAPALSAIARLGLKAIPRGAGTGLTGGAVPLHPECVIINTEKLDQILGLSEQSFRTDEGGAATAWVMEAEAGVITEKAMAFAETHGQVFATDPTSAWASTLGGNISENAGGKLAVRWGTCLDNLLSWRMAMPEGHNWTIRRTDHQLRKILPTDHVTFEVSDEAGAILKRIVLRGDEVRRKGLWKDITNKALGGLPGVQKEGTDGVITSAEFVLYPEYLCKRTLCLEFFGPDMDEASRVILELSTAFPFPDESNGVLLALEHFDDEYVRAINYKVKAPRSETPKAVLLVDVAGRDASQVERGLEGIQEVLSRHPNTLLFVAKDGHEAKHFWADRKKLGAIARRTNAFKLNEDIVIPLEALAEFARFVDRINIEEERAAQIQFTERAEDVFASAVDVEAPASFSEKAKAAHGICMEGRVKLQCANEKALRSMTLLETLRRDLAGLAQGYPIILEGLERTHQSERDRRIVLATHMHAGDGNVHVNVPVLSNDHAMLKRADRIIDEVMAKVVALGGVVSGEHGIGVTKLKYLEPFRMAELSAYRKAVDPGGLMNPGKLEDLGALERIFTPSFNLLELEARILQHGQLEELAKRIAHCVRCGKCKPDCCVFHPARGLFFHPRNKNLAIGALIEALLYDAQRERSTHFELLQWLNDVADHCTICHKCLKPCPVDIDTGEVSVLERETLTSWGYKRTSLATRMTLGYLDSQSPTFNRAFRAVVLQAGGALQRIGCTLATPFQPKEGVSPWYPMRMLRSPLPPAPSRTLRDMVPACAPDQVLIFEPASEASTTVFYFPGCGSERLHSDISMAAIHLLLETGTRVVVPPPFLCCGFPAHVNAKSDLHSRTVLRDTILFSQIRAMLAHLDFDACVVSCGTCREGLASMDADKLFGGRIVDVSAYAMERGLRFEGADVNLYHAPCHDSLDGKATQVLGAMGGFEVTVPVPHCCSEAGTLALSRPDITDAMLHRKRDALKEAMGTAPSAIVLTNCPSCIQGLGRNRAIGIQACHLAVALAKKHSGPSWLERFREQAIRAEAFHF
jgi:FAD/FMN-containing dehydrogenase/Fe-S oxidoreductase